MERGLDVHLEEVFTEPGVTGVLCSDHQGLPIAAKGTANLALAGVISAIAKEAGKLYPESDNTPVVALEGENSTVMVRSQDKIVLAVHKLKT